MSAILLKFKNSVNTPIRKNFIANLFGIGVNILNQIILVPFFILYWGNDLYSDWIVLSALATVFGMSDVGLNSVIQNRFAIKYSERNLKECGQLLIINIVIISVVFAVFLFASLLYLANCNIVDQMGLHYLGRKEGSFIFTMLLVQVFINMYNGIPNAIFRGVHRNSEVVFIDQLTKLIIFIVTLLCLLCGVEISVMSVLICIPIPISLIIKIYMSKRIFRFKYSWSNFNWSLFRNVLGPAVGYMSFPLGNAILLQGFTFVVNRYFGANIVVLYNTTRTMCNFIKTLLATVFNSVWPEFSIAYGEKNTDRMRLLYRKSIRISVVGAIVISAGLLLLGPLIYTIWTHGAVHFNYSLMTAFLVVLIINTIWYSGHVALLSTNNHIELGILNVFATVTSLVAAIFVAKYIHSISMIVYCTLIIDIVMVFYVHKKFLRVLKAI